ncbi:MAG TPA: hypothetical protein VJM46_04040 [Candidatus Saccharimonadales bacterium]|nr:hypothetical protein [Candidatus Saccharimonadales bacterium]
MLHPVGQSHNGIAVNVNLIQTDIAKQISWQPHLLIFVREALARASLRGERVVIERDMGRAIGYSFVVPTTDASKVFYVKLLRDDVYTRFVRDVAPVSTQFLTLTLGRSADGSYELSSIAVGKAVPPRPGSPDETDQSRPFWAEHAYVFDKQSVQAQSLTKECPY